MKVLIVDDEQDVRDSIRLLVNWAEFGITHILEASDGAAAMELIRSEKPEIIFTDMKMPNVDGIGLLQWIETEAPESKRIAVSGYDDSMFIRKTMKHGGLDYLLKPIQRGELLEALRNAVSSWRQAEENRRLTIQKNVEINQTKPVYWDKVLTKAVSQEGYYRTVAEELQSAFGWADVRECQLVMLLTDPLPRAMMEKFGHNPDLLYFLMTNICNEILGAAKNGYAFKHTDPNYGIVLLCTGDLASLPDKLAAMNEALYRVLDARFYFACGAAQRFPDRIVAGFLQALQTARSVSFSGDGRWIRPYVETAAPAEKRVVLAEYSESMIVAVFSGDRQRIETAVTNWMQAIGQLQAVTWDHLKYWRYEFELMYNRLLEKIDYAGDNPPPPLPRRLFMLEKDGSISLPEWSREWTEALMRIAEALKLNRQQEHNAIHAVKAFVDTHYRQTLSLQEIASRFFLSREYLSRRFKQVYNENLSEYIERVRIENAKVLLQNDQYSIAAVAEMVGYQDGRYFSKIFGKLTGMTPREYRKGLGGGG
ncbi:response regulator [Cohnella sp. LGH]|uniref:response regulator transcription factor n=1 Tax=Cohnella sp. LGH TaxID=1619153 RepID=UPI001ADA68E0|nr:response regulator [Cohnella sp. LGH]QTH43704.1 response regulator [Cohnella sp. LGH]